MIGKILKSGANFSSAVNYVVNKEKDMAEVLYAEGIREYLTSKEMIEDFKLQAKLNPRLKQCVGHCILSFSKDDLPKLNADGNVSETIQARAKEFLEKLGVVSTQVLCVRHFDREAEGLHAHLIFNRVSNTGKALSDHRIGYRSGTICKEMNEKYGYSNGKSGKNPVNRHRLRGTDNIKYMVRDAIKASLKSASNWEDLNTQLRYRGITVEFKYAGKTDLIQGVSFCCQDQAIKGSSVGYSFSKLDQVFTQNSYSSTDHKFLGISKGAFELILPEKNLITQQPASTLDFESIFSGFLSGARSNHSEDDEQHKRKRRLKR
jgi:hypothetical protein